MRGLTRGFRDGLGMLATNERAGCLPGPALLIPDTAGEILFPLSHGSSFLDTAGRES